MPGAQRRELLLPCDGEEFELALALRAGVGRLGTGVPGVARLQATWVDPVRRVTRDGSGPAATVRMGP